MNNIHGVQTAIVTQVIDPLSQGRVSVQFSTTAAPVEEWARVLLGVQDPAAGRHLQIGDEVLLAFQEGRSVHAFVIGKL